jgi:xanthine dehydrogenase small subunit
MAVLRASFQPISDMRASADYRREVLGNLLWRCWLESSTPPGQQVISLERLQPALLGAPALLEGTQ